MKKIKDFLNEKQTASEISKIFGGVIRDTGAFDQCESNGNITYEDTWNDKNGDGKMSNGEYIEYNDPCK